jgi:hypothetical protein
MAILKNVKVNWIKLDPERPVINKMDPLKPKKQWEVQIETEDKAVRKEWLDLGLKVKTVREDPSDDESKILKYTSNLRKMATKEDKPAPPVQVVDAKGNDFDPNMIGNGSIANIRLFQSTYTVEGTEKTRNTLMGLQMVKVLKYVSKPMENFDDLDTDTEVIEPTESTGATSGDHSEDDEY